VKLESKSALNLVGTRDPTLGDTSEEETNITVEKMKS